MGILNETERNGLQSINPKKSDLSNPFNGNSKWNATFGASPSITTAPLLSNPFNGNSKWNKIGTAK